jgi:CubicO group peptidase (beta-lactamase class C family)
MLRRHTFSAFLCILVLALSAAAQPELPTAEPKDVGLSAERLERIGTAVQKAIDEKRIAGVVTLVMRRGKIAWAKAQGMQDREAGKPMQLDTIFRLHSMTKPLTAVAAMILYEEGHFLLDDPISKYLPEFKNMNVFVKPEKKGENYHTTPAKREITIRDLLRHTSGLTYPWNPDIGPIYNKANIQCGVLPYDGTLAENIRNLAKMPLLFSPGEKWEYGLNMDVLGRLIEVVSGKPLDDFMRTRLFEPLGMKDAYFFPPQNKLDRLAAAYTYYPEKGLNVQTSQITDKGITYSADYPYRGAKKLFSGGSGLNSTVFDYARFAQMMLDNGKFGDKRILSRKTVELMTHDQLGDLAADATPDFGWGFGFSIDGIRKPLNELGSIGTFGWGGYIYTSFFIDPKEQMIVIFLAQLRPHKGLNLEELVGQLAYQAIDD